MAHRRSTLWKDDLHTIRPASVPPESNFSRRSFMSVARTSSRPPHTNSEGLRGNFQVRDYQSPDSPPLFQRKSRGLDLLDDLHHSGSSVVKTRTGSVLSRGFILKTDHYPSGRALDLDLNVHGAPNFRAPRQGHLNVFGAAQPRTQGLRAILSILRCRPKTPNPTHVVWFSTREEPIVYISGRSFVLRDASQPRRTLSMSDRAENLEAIEERLKNDILQEANKFGGLLLTHNEVATDSGEGAILPTWTAVDTNNVKTSRELWEFMKREGWNVDYHRIPISPDRPIEDNYLDAYLQILKETDPLGTAVVFTCGTGSVRTTFAMVAASIIRRTQLLAVGEEDPYPLKPLLPLTKSQSGTARSGTSTPTNQQTETRILQALERANAQQDHNKSLLRLTYVLQQSLRNTRSQSAIDLLMTKPTLLENLRKAHMGNYSVILSLLGCLEHGLQAKQLVDRIIDSCDHVTNLRESILVYRLKYSLTTMDEAQGADYLNRARMALEKYFFMIAFASYAFSKPDFSQSFSDWLSSRSEIWNQVLFLRRIHGSRLNMFAPVNDLSALSKTGSEHLSLIPGKNNEVAIAGGQILGDEYTEHVIKNRRGIILRESTLLKSDQWLRASQHVEDDIRGAINFRNVPDTMIYALGQPTTEAIKEVLKRIRSAHPHAERIVWITLREEPIVYINGAPYCLRREGSSLRNMKDYGGISASRLEVLEERLREDVVAELNAFGGSVLLHTETSDGSVVPIWEEVQSEDVGVLKDIMANVSDDGFELCYYRIPITAERPPDFSDLSELMDVVVRFDSTNTPMVVNCQLGRGRSTLTSTILLLIKRWLEADRPSAMSRSRALSRSSIPNRISESTAHVPKRHSYQVINNLLRVTRRGFLVKDRVDAAIDQCALVWNLRESIEEERARAADSTDERQKRMHAQMGLRNLKRYFELMVFQSYLQSTQPDTMQSFATFESFVQSQPVIRTFEKELLADDLNALVPLKRAEADGEAHPDEVKQVVMNRSGRILSASTILKSDFFSNLQKMTLPERIEGSPNFRRVPLTLRLSTNSSTVSGHEVNDTKMVCGSGMPTVQGLRRALARVNADPAGQNMAYWTSLREEPVLYVAGRPHVLRLVDKPLENVEATGVTTTIVERMEENLKEDVLRELRAGVGRILLHDEVEERPGIFSIVPLWESVSEQDIMTPRDVFDLVAREGYKIDYDRVAITDEQAPLPVALAQLLERIKAGLSKAGDFIFNCQMGRGRTTSGMVTACLISTIMSWTATEGSVGWEDSAVQHYDWMDGPSEEEAYLQGEYKTILQLVAVLSHGKIAKRITDCAIDKMQDVQNLRKAIYDYKLKAEACEKGRKEQKLRSVGVNYLYRYGTLIVFANFLIELKWGKAPESTFPQWLDKRREISRLLERRSLE